MARVVSPDEEAPDPWLAACRRAVTRVREDLAGRTTQAERVAETGERGGGGDRTLELDQAAEDAIFSELQRLHDAGERFCVVSEERGLVDFGDEGRPVVVDPIDGSLNAKRGMPAHAISVALADGPTMADVAFGFVHDLGTGEEWVARRGEGAWLDGTRLDPGVAERRAEDGKLEVVGIESADPRWVSEIADDLVPVVGRLRAMGAIALTLCQVGAGRLDGMLSLKRCRSFDAAAAQLVVREAGGRVAFPGYDPPLSHPFDLEPRSPVVAARSDRALGELAALLR